MTQICSISIISTATQIGSVSVKNWRFEWAIHDFFSYIDINSWFHSPHFNVFDSTWYMKIYPFSKEYDESKERVSLFLYKHGTPMAFEYRLGIKTVDNTIEYETASSSQIFGPGGWGYEDFIQRSKLLQRKSELIPSDILTITCFVRVKEESPSLDSARKKLAENLRNMFISKEHTDVTLHVKAKTFAAHKVVLAARSSVFAAMFQNDMLEKKTGEINIFDCDPDTFDAFLLFLYSASVDFENCNNSELYKIAHKYDVSDLKSICIDFMDKILSVENFAEILILADEYDDRKLSARVQNFFDENFKSIVSSDSWEYLFKENFCLVNNLLKAMTPKVGKK